MASKYSRVQQADEEAPPPRADVVPMAKVVSGSESGVPVVMGVAVQTSAPASSPTSSSPPSDMTIFLKTIDDRTLPLAVHAETSLQEFRTLVWHATGVLPSDQRLIANGRVLVNEGPLGLPNRSFVHLAAPPPTATALPSDAEMGMIDTVEPESVVQGNLTAVRIGGLSPASHTSPSRLTRQNSMGEYCVVQPDGVGKP